MNSINRFDEYRKSIAKIEAAKLRKAKRAEKAKELGHAKKVKKVPKAKLRKRLIKALDAEFSKFIRSMFKACPFCQGPVEHCFHFVTRAKYSVRWDPRNAVGSCAGCNYRYEFDPHFSVTWYINTRGLKAYEELIAAGNQIKKWDNTELELLLGQYVLQNKALDTNNGTGL